MLLFSGAASVSAMPTDVQLHEMSTSLHESGVAVLRGFSSTDETAAMIKSMQDMVADWWAKEQHSAAEAEVFRTDEGQEAAQAASDYFFSSADKVHFFREPPANIGAEANESEACASEGEVEAPPLNKVGHGLHLDASTPFGRYAQSEKVAAVLTQILKAPVLPQSMYIFKPALSGSVVTAHQDASFLYTTPSAAVWYTTLRSAL